MRKIERTGGRWTKKNFFPPSFVVGSCLLVVLCSWHSVHRHSGAHSVKTGWWRGGVDRGHVGSCCKPNRGHLIRGITFCVTFPNQHPLFFCFFANLGVCWERRTPDCVAATEQILGGVYLTCVGSLPRCFGGL